MKEWKRYDCESEYEKEFYDIKLNDNSIYLYCWLNAGWFHTGMGEISGDLVSQIRISEEKP